MQARRHRPWPRTYSRSAAGSAELYSVCSQEERLDPGNGRLDLRVRLRTNAQVKTNAARLLDQARVAYELRDYEVDLRDLSAIKVANQIGMPPGQVFKTLVAKGGSSGIVLAVVPGDREIDLKALARVSGDRSLELVPVAQLQQLTGYVRGGVTALGCKKSYPVYLDNSSMNFERIAVSAGVRGTQIVLAPRDYARCTNAVVAQLTRPAVGGRDFES